MDVTHPNYGLTESLEEAFATKESLNPLPRAVLRPNSYVLLDGEWKFAIDLEDVGIKDGWYNGHAYPATAHWPGSIEEHMLAAKDAQSGASTWDEKVIAWYEREFPLPLKAEDGVPDSLFQLTFGACGYETQVWLNGILLNTIEGESIHRGEYTSFSYELHRETLQENNRLTVRIADTMDADLPRGKQESSVYKRGGIWYQTYTGAVRSIWLETVERNRLRSRVGVVSIVEDNLVRFNLTTRIHDAGRFSLKLFIYRPNEGRKKAVAFDQYPLHLEAGQKNQRVVIAIPDARLWSPEDPQLYVLVAQLVDESGYAAEIETQFGLRKIEARGKYIYLNNQSIYLDGILYQPGTATYEQIRLHMLAMKELGCNLVRIHIAGIDPRIYNLADQIGMLLWVEVPSPHRSSALSREAHKEELLRMLALIGTHPSVVIWSLYNEDWGAQDIANNEETRRYIIEVYHYMKLAQPQFLVVDNDGWQHISFEGRLKSDLLTAHLYTPELQHWENLLDGLSGGKLEGVAAFPLAVGDPFFFRNQLPLLVSEWGGFGFADYGGPKEAADRASQITLYKQALRKRPIAGDVYTQATNIEDEQNGIIDGATGELKVPAGLLRSGSDL